jgi:hypothetical protein
MRARSSASMPAGELIKRPVSGHSRLDGGAPPSNFEPRSPVYGRVSGMLRFAVVKWKYFKASRAGSLLQDGAR